MLNNRDKRWLLAAGISMVGVGGVQAAESEALDTLVVLGTGQQVSVFDNPASVSTVDAAALGRASSASVAELLRDVPGLTIQDNGSPGMPRITLRGESSRRVTVQIDGHALTDHSPKGAPLLLDPSTIERIEVVRGPSSVLSGSNAIGGVVNIITRRGGDTPFSGSVTATGHSATRGGSTSATLQGARGNVDWRVSAGVGDEGDRRTPDGTLDNTGHAHDQLSTHLGYRFNAQHYLAFKADQYRLEADVYSPPPAGFTDFSVSLPQRDLRKSGLFYEGTELTPWLGELKASVYYQTVDRRFESQAEMASGRAIGSESDDRQITYGMNTRATLDLIAPGKTLVGVEYEHDSLEADKTSRVFLPFPPPQGQHQTKSIQDEAHIETFSAYAQQALALGDATTLYLGARGYLVEANLDASSDKPLTDNSDERLLGSLGLVHRPSDDWSLRANLAQGYSYPTLEQLFLTTSASGTDVYGNPDLSPERANTLELGARYRGGPVTLDATLFHTRAKDYIGEEDLPAAGPGPAARHFINVDRANTTGLELLAEYALPTLDTTTLYAKGSVLERELDYGQVTTTDSGTPRFSGRAGVRHARPVSDTLMADADLYLRGESGAKLRNADGELTSRASGYGTLNARLGLGHSEHFDLGLTLYNLLDTSYDAYGEVPGAERSASLTGTLYF